MILRLLAAGLVRTMWIVPNRSRSFGTFINIGFLFHSALANGQ